MQIKKKIKKFYNFYNFSEFLQNLIRLTFHKNSAPKFEKFEIIWTDSHNRMKFTVQGESKVLNTLVTVAVGCEEAKEPKWISGRMPPRSANEAPVATVVNRRPRRVEPTATRKKSEAAT